MTWADFHPEIVEAMANMEPWPCEIIPTGCSPCGQPSLVMGPGGELVSEYLWFQFQAMKPEFERLMTGSTHRTIYQADAASFTIIVPPISEQREIVEQLDNVTRRIDEAIATAQSGVALARERRAALISAAVTGKIDVGVAV